MKELIKKAEEKGYKIPTLGPHGIDVVLQDHFMLADIQKHLRENTRYDIDIVNQFGKGYTARVFDVQETRLISVGETDPHAILMAGAKVYNTYEQALKEGISKALELI